MSHKDFNILHKEKKYPASIFHLPLNLLTLKC